MDLAARPVAKTNPQTDNRSLLLIWHRCRLPVHFLSFLPQEGSEALFLRWGELWVFLYEFLSWTMGHLWTMDAPHGGHRCPEAASGECKRGSTRICVLILKTDAFRRFNVSAQMIWRLKDAVRSRLKCLMTHFWEWARKTETHSM